MDSKYDRVSYPENVYLAGQGEGEVDEFGTGVYPTVSQSQRTRGYREPSFKLACIKVKRQPPVFLIVSAGVALVFIVVIALIAHAVVSRQSQHQNANVKTLLQNSNDKPYGLFIYPQLDSSSLISFSASKYSTYKDYLDQLDHYVHDYNVIVQQNNKAYVECDTGDVPPEGKVCRFDATKFNEFCSHIRNYGYNTGQPCVMLVLKLPQDVTPKPFNSFNDNVTRILGNRRSLDNVGITCDGDTAEDRRFIGHQQELGESIIYNPAKGFPLYMYPKRNISEYVYPAVMVQFSTLSPLHLITMKCVAWAENFNHGQPQSSDLFTAKFQFQMEGHQ